MSYEIGKALKRKKSGKKFLKAEKQLAKSKAKNKKSIDISNEIHKELNIIFEKNPHLNSLLEVFNK